MFQIEKLQYLQIGVQGENDALDIEIDMTNWVEQLPDDVSFHVLFKPYNETSPVPMTSNYESNILTWTVSLSATQNVGVGYTEIRAINPSGLIKKSRIIPTSVEHSVSGVEAENPPASYQGWVNQVLGYSRVAEGFAKGTEGGVASQTYATDNSKYYKEVSEQWATGGTGGTPSATNNSKYWNEQSEEWATGGSSGTPGESNNAKYWSEQSEKWANNGTGGTPGATDNAKYWCDQAERAAEVAITHAGQIKFEINQNGHLIFSYTEQVPVPEEV